MWFGASCDGIFITGVHQRHAQALGCRLVAVGDTPLATALEAVGLVVSAENESWRATKSLGLLGVPQLLAILGLVVDLRNNSGGNTQVLGNGLSRLRRRARIAAEQF